MRLSIEQKKKYLEGFIPSLKLKENYFIHTVNKGKDSMFTLAYKSNWGLVTPFAFRNYKEFCAF